MKQSKLTIGQKFELKGKCKKNHFSAISNSAWCDLNCEGDILKLHDMCPNHTCICQKQIIFTDRQFQVAGTGFKKKLQKYFKGP